MILMLPRWKAASPACVVTDAYVVTTATHADRTDCIKDPICLQSEQSLR